MDTKEQKVNKISEPKLFFLPVRFLKFSVVGFTGVVVNMGLLYILTERFALYYMISSGIAIGTSIFSNFIINDLWTWGDRKKFTKTGYFTRMFKYHVSAGIAASVGNFLSLVVLTEIAGIYYIISNLVGIAVGVIINFLLNDRWTYKLKGV
ncbi:MAG: GtrA family protein [candidate division Zixibacteria bacterium]|nr:GtrA family protein [candidate division Zixibacteria bacterium]